MDKRKIIKLGNTSFTIALPINWIRKNKLDKGSELNIVEHENGELVLSPEIVDEEKKENIEINIDNKEIDEISYEIINSYLFDYSTITLIGKNLGKMKKSIVNELDNLFGIDVLEQTSEKLVLKNFSTFDKSVSPTELTKKLILSIESMFEVLFEILDKKNIKNNNLEIDKSHKHNFKINALTRKTILRITEKPALMSFYKTTYFLLSKQKSVLGFLLQLSYILKFLAKPLSQIETKEDKEKIKSMLEVIINEFLRIVKVIKTNKDNKDLLKYLNKNRRNSENWSKELQVTNNPYLTEIMNYIIFINHILRQLAIEIAEE